MDGLARFVFLSMAKRRSLAWNLLDVGHPSKGGFEAQKLLPPNNCSHSPHRCIEATVDAVGHVWKEVVSCKSAVDAVAVADCEGKDSLRMVSCCRYGTSPHLLDSLPGAADSRKRVADMLDSKSCY